MNQSNNQAVALLLSRPSTRIGDAFTALDELEEPIDTAELDVRSVNTLLRLRCNTWADLARHTVGELLSSPMVGQLTVSRLLTAAAHRNELTRPAHLAFGLHDTTRDVVPERPGLVELHRLLTDLAAWAVRERGARLLSDLVQLSDNLGAIPEEIAARFERLAGLELQAFGIEESPRLPSGLVGDLLAGVGERVDVLVRRKIQQHDRPTLREFGDSLGVTRERVRQLEVAAANKATAMLHTDRFRPLRWRASDLRDVLGSAVPEDSEELRDALVWATRDLDDPTTCSAAEVLLWIAGPYDLDSSGWLIVDGMSLKELVVAFNRHVGLDWLLSEGAALDALAKIRLSPTLLDVFLSTDSHWRRIDAQWWVRWDGPIADKAATVLRLSCTPLRLEQINSAIGEGHAATTLRNALTADPRFVRLDKAGTYGLSDWGLEEYSGIAQEIMERIDRQGGTVRVEDLIAEFVSQFGVSENSVRAYAASPAFVVEGGSVRLRGEDEPYQADSRIARHRGAYLSRRGVVVQVVVDRDVLRGSGQQFYEAAAVALGVVPGKRRTFGYDDDIAVAVTWPVTSVMGPSLGSVRGIVLDLALGEGEHFNLIFDAVAGTCTASPVDTESLVGLTGLELEPGHEVESLARALGVAPTEVRAALQARGDHEVLGMLPPPPMTDELGQAISDFGELLG